MSLLAFLLSVGLVQVLGVCLAHLLLGPQSRPLRWALGLPLGALCTALLFLPFTIVHIPLTAATLWGGSALIILALCLLLHFRPAARALLPRMRPPQLTQTHRRLIVGGSCIVVTITCLYAFVHALLLPSMHGDSLSQWAMRSQLSFYDQQIAFDADESRGMSKPQYPILLHALQIMANQGQPLWNDRAANAVQLLFTLSSAAALFLCVRLLRGTTMALLCVGLVFSIPLAAFHTMQGYADLPLMQYVLLAVVTVFIALESQDGRWLHLAAVLVAGAAATKQEGLFVALVPFLLLLIIVALRTWLLRRDVMRAGLIALACTLPFPLYNLFAGLSLTPHAGDAAPLWNTEGFAPMLSALFRGGGVGISMYLLIAIILLLIPFSQKTSSPLHAHGLLLCSWGLLVFAEYVVLYLFTPNIQFLLNEQSFNRQMIVPFALLALACALGWGSEVPGRSKE